MSEGQRRLAAIMFTDMVGYTALGQKNESLSLALVEEQRKIIRPVLAKHNGREVKTIGDAFLVEFASALDAVRCAYEIQRATKEFNLPLAEDKRVHLRIGVHLGDVVESQGDISGDAVNVASRIEPLAENGGVCITRQVYDHVKGKVDIPLLSLGPKSLKNVAEPVELFRMQMPWEKESLEPSLELDSKRLAVLPFVSLSPDPNDEFFADGLTEELIDKLCQVRELEVIARTSVMAYKKREKKAAEIGRELRIGALVEGSVRKAGNRIRVTAQLINVSNEAHLWSSSYDRNMDDVFAVQSDIAEKVAEALRVKLLPSEKDAMERVPTSSNDAYELYLKGQSHTHRGTEEDYMTALGYFEQAIQRDPKFARAYAEMSQAYSWLGYFEMISSGEAIAGAKRSARKALELDGSLGTARIALARALTREYDFAGALREARTAVEQNPNLASAHITLANFNFLIGRLEDALPDYQRALELDPKSVEVLQGMATYYIHLEPDRAIQLYERALELDPNSAIAVGNIGFCLVKKGQYEDGIAKIREGISMSQSVNPSAQADLVYGLLSAGRTDEARKILSDLVAFHGKTGRGAASIAFSYGDLGEVENALEWFERAYTERSGGLIGVGSDLGTEKFRSDPRFRAFLKRRGLERVLT